MLTTQILLIKPSADVGSCHTDIYSSFSYNLSIIHCIQILLSSFKTAEIFLLGKQNKRESTTTQTDILAHSFSGMLDFTFGLFLSMIPGQNAMALSASTLGWCVDFNKSLFEEPVTSRMEL